jgi:hypothetical protein
MQRNQHNLDKDVGIQGHAVSILYPAPAQGQKHREEEDRVAR